MTAKERRAMRKLEIRAEEAERMLKHINQMSMDQFFTVYEDRCAMMEAFGLLSEAKQLLWERIKKDPQFMAKNKREGDTE